MSLLIQAKEGKTIHISTDKLIGDGEECLALGVDKRVLVTFPTREPNGRFSSSVYEPLVNNKLSFPYSGTGLRTGGNGYGFGETTNVVVDQTKVQITVRK